MAAKSRAVSWANDQRARFASLRLPSLPSLPPSLSKLLWLLSTSHPNTNMGFAKVGMARWHEREAAAALLLASFLACSGLAGWTPGALSATRASALAYPGASALGCVIYSAGAAIVTAAGRGGRSPTAVCEPLKRQLLSAAGRTHAIEVAAAPFPRPPLVAMTLTVRLFDRL